MVSLVMNVFRELGHKLGRTSTPAVNFGEIGRWLAQGDSPPVTVILPIEKERETFAQLGEALGKTRPEDLAVYNSYLAVLDEYQWPAKVHSIPYEELKGDFYLAKREDGSLKIDVNTGWKCHLDVSPENCVAVSNWLLANGYIHKFLSGGEPEDGKVFTVYLGSNASAKVAIKDISDNITFLLSENRKVAAAKTSQPSGEIRLAPKIYGRFRSNNLVKYHAYGSDGVVYLEQDSYLSNARTTKDSQGNMALAEQRTKAANKAKMELLKDYGDYYGGDIREYTGKS